MESRLGHGICLDVETTGLDPHADELRCVGYEENRTGEIRVRPWVRENEKVGEGFPSLDYWPQVIGANIGFDLQWFLEDRKIPNVRTIDVQFLHYLLDEHYPVRNLKHLFLLYTPYEDYEPEVKPHELPDEQLYPYNALDVKATRLVYEGITKELHELGVDYERTLSLMSRVQPVLAAMEYTGIPIDTNILQQVVEDEERKVVELETRVREQCGNINLNSHQQLSEFIFGDEGLGLAVPDVKDVRNKDGSVSTRKDVLVSTEDNTGFVESLLEYKNIRDNLKKYVINIRDRVCTHDHGNRLHPTYRTYKTAYGGTTTGRLSVNDPPIHNVPRGHPIRRAFTPFSEDGYVIQMDLSQIELVVLAYMSQDEELIRAIESNEDLHTWMAETATDYGYPITRQDAKVVNYGVLYGVSAWGLQEQTSINNKSAAQDIINLWYERFRDVRAWQEDIEEQTWRSGYVTTPYGRRRNFPPFSKRSREGFAYLREAKNFPIQAMASDINLLILADTSDFIRESYPDVFPLTVIHDAILWSVDSEEALEDWLDELEGYFQEDLITSINTNWELDFNVPIGAEIKVGRSWADKDEAYQMHT